MAHNRQQIDGSAQKHLGQEGRPMDAEKHSPACEYCGRPEDSLYWDGHKAVVACKACATERQMFSYLGRVGDAESQERVRGWGAQLAEREAQDRATQEDHGSTHTQ